MTAEKTPHETSLKGMIQKLATGEVEILQGVVKSVSPLKIQIAGDDKLTIGESITYIPKHLTEHKVKCSFKKSDFSFSGDITVYNALEKGDTVHILSFMHGKQYYVLDRIEE